jgi:hypothetical protein
VVINIHIEYHNTVSFIERYHFEINMAIIIRCSRHIESVNGQTLLLFDDAVKQLEEYIVLHGAQLVR